MTALGDTRSQGGARYRIEADAPARAQVGSCRGRHEGAAYGWCGAIALGGEAAERLGVHPNTLAGWVKRGWLAGVKMPSGEVRFREEEVEALRDRIYAV
jgi:excisionase family DNA binding protein